MCAISHHCIFYVHMTRIACGRHKRFDQNGKSYTSDQTLSMNIIVNLPIVYYSGISHQYLNIIQLVKTEL